MRKEFEYLMLGLFIIGAVVLSNVAHYSSRTHTMFYQCDGTTQFIYDDTELQPEGNFRYSIDVTIINMEDVNQTINIYWVDSVEALTYVDHPSNSSILEKYTHTLEAHHVNNSHHTILLNRNYRYVAIISNNSSQSMGLFVEEHYNNVLLHSLIPFIMLCIMMAGAVFIDLIAKYDRLKRYQG